MATHGVEYTRRYYRRSAQPNKGWMPWGCLPLAGLVGTALFAVWPFATNWIEGTTRDKTELALEKAGMEWVKVDVDGQYVHLTGNEPAAGAGNKAIELAKSVSASTWLFSAAPAISVTGDFGKAAPKPAAKPAVAAKPMDWTWRWKDKVLTLEGEVPDQGTKTSLVAAAEKQADKVIDKLTVRGIPASAAFSAVGMRGLSTLTRCDQGTSSWKSRVFSIHCLIDDSVKAAVDTDARAPIEGGQVGVVELLVPAAVEKCEKAMSALLAKSKIQFTSGSAKIAAASNPLLDKIAEEAKACPGTLLIEGHTDSQGADDFNMNLSNDRANATRQALIKRGVKADHLRARGFGETRPIGDNTTPEGMKKNRRIEFHVTLED